MVIDDDDGDFLAQAVKGSNNAQSPSGQALERLVQQQYPDVARQCPRYRDHLLFAAGQIIRGLSSRCGCAGSIRRCVPLSSARHGRSGA